jgi:hypothetical protein
MWLFYSGLQRSEKMAVKVRIIDLKSIPFSHDKCGLENSPSILEGVPEGRGSNIKDWPIGHP